MLVRTTDVRGHNLTTHFSKLSFVISCGYLEDGTVITFACLPLTGDGACGGVKFELGEWNTLHFNVVGAHEDHTTEVGIG